MSTLEQALAAEADYLGAGPVWETPSKLDADPALGLEAAVDDAQGFAVVGRVEAGDGVVTLHDGTPYALRGWEHFSAG